MSKLSALSRHESLVLERRLLRAIGQGAAAKQRLLLDKRHQVKEAVPAKVAGTAAPARKLKGIGLRTV